MDLNKKKDLYGYLVEKRNRLIKIIEATKVELEVAEEELQNVKDLITIVE